MFLQVDNIDVSYRKVKVLHGVSLSAERAEIIAILGKNGAGKSTLLKAIFGLLPVEKGSIIYQGKAIQNRKTALNVKDGIVFVPQGGRVFPSLSVRQNLELGAYVLNHKGDLKKKLNEALELFPILNERSSQCAGTLSGGERQMLALGRALMASPTLLLLDEPSVGIAPNLVPQLLQKIKEINHNLGATILLVEQNAREALSIAHKAYTLEAGRVILYREIQKPVCSDDGVAIYNINTLFSG
jgi:branched-chain amino acid transport system ATP-binding protein